MASVAKEGDVIGAALRRVLHEVRGRALGLPRAQRDGAADQGARQLAIEAHQLEDDLMGERRRRHGAVFSKRCSKGKEAKLLDGVAGFVRIPDKRPNSAGQRGRRQARGPPP